MSTENQEGTDSVLGDNLFGPHLLFGLEFVNPVHRVFGKMALYGAFCRRRALLGSRWVERTDF